MNKKMMMVVLAGLMFLGPISGMKKNEDSKKLIDSFGEFLTNSGMINVYKEKVDDADKLIKAKKLESLLIRYTSRPNSSIGRLRGGDWIAEIDLPEVASYFRDNVNYKKNLHNIISYAINEVIRKVKRFKEHSFTRHLYRPEAIKKLENAQEIMKRLGASAEKGLVDSFPMMMEGRKKYITNEYVNKITQAIKEFPKYRVDLHLKILKLIDERYSDLKKNFELIKKAKENMDKIMKKGKRKIRMIEEEEIFEKPSADPKGKKSVVSWGKCKKPLKVFNREDEMLWFTEKMSQVERADRKIKTTKQILMSLSDINKIHQEIESRACGLIEIIKNEPYKNEQERQEDIERVEVMWESILTDALSYMNMIQKNKKK